MSKVVLMVMCDGRVLRNVGALSSAKVYRLMRDANFVVIEYDGMLQVMKERFQPDLDQKVISYQEMLDHAARHVQMCKSTAT